MGGFLGGIFGLAGSAAQAAMSWKMQQDAQEHQKDMYKQRYQWTMEDMRSAGLNPMLAYAQGVGGGAGGAGIGGTPNFGQNLTGGMESGAKTSRVKDEKELIRQQRSTSAAQAEREASSTDLNRALETKALADTMKAHAETNAARNLGIKYLYDGEMSSANATAINLENVERAQRAGTLGGRKGRAYEEIRQFMRTFNPLSGIMKGGR